MTDHKTGTREEWEAARAEVAKLEAEQAERNQQIQKMRRELPWVPVEKDYEFDTEDGKKSLADLFDGRSQLLAYNIMYGPDYEIGACPGCSNLGDELDGSMVHMNHRDVTLMCFSRAPIDRLVAYKERMGWNFPWVSTYETDFPFDFGLAMTEEQAEQIPEVKEIIENPPDWLQEWSQQVGGYVANALHDHVDDNAGLRDLGENPAGHARHIAHIVNGHLRLIAFETDAADHHVFHVRGLLLRDCPGGLFETGANFKFDAEFLGEFD